MQLTVLGSGTAVPHPRRTSSAYWVEGSDGCVVLDFSVTALQRMMDEGLPWPRMDAVWISHFHLDHIGGLPAFLFGSRYAEELKGRQKPLRIFGSEGLGKLLQGFSDLGDYKLLKQPFRFEVVEIEPLEPFDIAPGLQAVALKTPHTDDSYAIHLRDINGSTLVYSADTGYDLALAAFARKVDILVIEASFPKNKPGKNHLEFAETMQIVRRAEPKRAVVTHLYPYWDGIDLAKAAKKYDPLSEVIEARDGLRVSTSDER
jgi:ribonuclease BN (tRNA processing enzyme)